MTVTIPQLGLYAGALFILFMTPGPVWVAMIARTLAGGLHSAWPMALGVAVGDVLWPLMAIFGVTLIATVWADFLLYLRYVAAIMFLVMGWLLIRHADKALGSNSKLTAPGMWAGFLAGLLVILGNPKAILFYMGLLPGFFSFEALSWQDIAAICAISAVVPFAGNLALAASIERVRVLLASPEAVRRTNMTAGGLLMAVGVFILLKGI